MAKKTKKSVYTHHELGIYNGITFKLVIPSKANTEKYPNYFIQYNGSEKYYNGIKSLYVQFCNLEMDIQTTKSLIDCFLPIINNEIIPNISISSRSLDRLRQSDKVTKAVNKFLNQQEELFSIGELVDISDYRDRNKKLNDYFAVFLSDKLTLSDLNKDVWLEFRYYLLRSYKIKSNSTVNQYITYVKSFYNWLQNDQELMIINHVMKLKRLDTSKQKPKYDFIELGKVNEFLNALASDERWLRLNIVSLLVFENAKRPIQAYRLQAKDIDLDNKTLLLHPKSRNKSKEVTFISDELVMGVILKVATSFYPKWPHITLQSGQLISVKSDHLAYFKGF
jgi:hypothetical protein